MFARRRSITRFENRTTDYSRNNYEQDPPKVGKRVRPKKVNTKGFLGQMIVSVLDAVRDGEDNITDAKGRTLWFRNRPDVVDFFQLVDASASMDGKRIGDVKETIIENAGFMRDEDKFSVIEFGTKSTWRIKPKSIATIKREGDFKREMDKINTIGLTSLWDAIWMAIHYRRDKSKRKKERDAKNKELGRYTSIKRSDKKNRDTVIIAVVDGEDNSSKRTFEEVAEALKKMKNVSVSIVHIESDRREIDLYKKICKIGHGDYVCMPEMESKAGLRMLFRRYYLRDEGVTFKESKESKAIRVGSLSKHKYID